MKGKRGGARRGAGAVTGNKNAQKRIQLPESMRLDSVESVLEFVRTILVPATLNGSIGVRQSTAVTSALKLLLEFDPDLAHLKEVEEGLVRLEEEDKRIQEDIRALKENVSNPATRVLHRFRQSP
jgi:hypothetical protein